MHSVGWRRRSRGYRSTQWEDATNILGVALGLGPLPSSDGDSDSVVEPHSGESNAVVAMNDVVGDGARRLPHCDGQRGARHRSGTVTSRNFGAVEIRVLKRPL